MAGPSCALSTMHLAANGLYAAKRRHTFSIPYRCSDLDSLTETLECLLTTKKEIQLIADEAIKERKKTRTTAVSFNEQKKPFINDRLSWIRGTWYTPPSGQNSTVPIRCVGPPPPPPNISNNDTVTPTEQPEDVKEGAATKCRASSSFTSHPFLQPTTIWTFPSQNGSTLINLSQDKIGALIFRTLAIRVCKDGAHASLDRAAVDEIAALAKNTSALAILTRIQGLFDNQEKIGIIGNTALNSQLTDLANKICKKKKEDDKTIQNIIKQLYD